MSAQLTNPRAAAAYTLDQVLTHGRSLNQALIALKVLADPDQALARELCYGVLRGHERFDALIGCLLHKSLRRRDHDLKALLEIGLYQLMHLRIPVHAAVYETVQAAEMLGKPWAKALCNNVLRRFTAEQGPLLAQVNTSEHVRYTHPKWLLDRLKQHYPERWPAICESGNQHPPLSLRVNTLRTTRDDYLQLLSQAGLEGHAHSWVPTALTLTQAVNVERLPGFAEGLVSVQDAAAQLAAPLLAPTSGMRVLDACAAPGGKTTHILELMANTVSLTALDIDAERLGRLDDNLNRLGLNARVIQGDVTQPSAWWDGMKFDRILVDAPCSGTGVIRRHPDIKVLRREADIAQLQTGQFSLLHTLWPLLNNGGMLLYVTCSILPEENTEVVSLFLGIQPDARRTAFEFSSMMHHTGELQILSGDMGMDGFYYARLLKP